MPIFCDPSFSQGWLRVASQLPPSMGRGCTPWGPKPLSEPQGGLGRPAKARGLQAGGKTLTFHQAALEEGC